MADSMQGIKISDLPEAAQSQLTDASVAVVDDGTTTRKTKLSTFVAWLKGKLGIGAMQEDINNLNTKIKDYVKVVVQTGPNTFAIKAGQAMEASSHMSLPSLSGYTRVLYIVKTNGNPAVLSTGPNSGWIINTGKTDASSIRLDVIGIFVRNI